MLAKATYAQAYIDACRARIDGRLAAHATLATAVEHDPAARAALAALEDGLFGDLVIVLHAMFVDRERGQEGTDGGPMDEVRLLAESLLGNGGVMVADPTVRLSPDTAVLGASPGDRVVVDADGFRHLAEAYFAAVERARVSGAGT